MGLQPKAGGKLHPKLNSGTRPIANKYREGKVKSTLKRESKRPRNRWEGSARRRAVSAVELSMACLHLGCRGACSGESSRLRSEERRRQESCGAACALSTRTHQRGSPRAHKSERGRWPGRGLGTCWELIARRLWLRPRSERRSRSVASVVRRGGPVGNGERLLSRRPGSDAGVESLPCDPS